MQRCCQPVGNSRLPAIPVLASGGGPRRTARALRGEPEKKKTTKEEFSQLWLTLATIKDAIWTSRNLLARRRMQIPPLAMIRMSSTMVQAAVAAGLGHSHKNDRLCAHLEVGATHSSQGRGGMTLKVGKVGKSKR